MFWSGMHTRQRSATRFGLVATFVLIFVAPWISTQSYIWGVVASIALTGATFLATAVLGERLSARLGDRGERCACCGFLFGLTDTTEAFREHGYIGSLSAGYEAYLLCPQGTRTPVPWPTAYIQMISELCARSELEVGEAERLPAETPAEIKYRRIEDARQIARRAAQLAKGDPAKFRYYTAERLLRELEAYENRPWPKYDTGELYRFLARLEALAQLRHG